MMLSSYMHQGHTIMSCKYIVAVVEHGDKTIHPAVLHCFHQVHWPSTLLSHMYIKFLLAHPGFAVWTLSDVPLTVQSV